MRRAVVVMGKAPVPGTVKTRLVPPLDPQQAAHLYAAFLRDTLLTALAVEDASVVLSHLPADDLSMLHDLVPAGVTCIEDAGTDLGGSMRQAFRHCFERDAVSVVVIGSDLPTLPAGVIEAAFATLERRLNDVVLGPSVDGGYYLIGLRADQPTLFEGMVWSTDRVLMSTLVRARRSGLRAALLAPWYDIDRPSDLQRLLRELAGNSSVTAPTTRHALAMLWPNITPPHDNP